MLDISLLKVFRFCHNLLLYGRLKFIDKNSLMEIIILGWQQRLQMQIPKHHDT